MAVYRETAAQAHALEQKQVIWETPRNIAILAGSVAAIVAALAGFVGYKAGQTAARPQQVIQLPVGSTITITPRVDGHD